MLAKDFPKPAMLTKDITGKSYVNNIYSWIRLQYMNERYSWNNLRKEKTIPGIGYVHKKNPGIVQV